MVKKHTRGYKRSMLLGICCHEYRGFGFQQICASTSLSIIDTKSYKLLHVVYTDSHLSSFLKLVRNQFTSESTLFITTSVILVTIVIFVQPGNTGDG